MLELAIGAVIGTIVSLLIAELYHRRSSRSLNALISALAEKNAELGKTLAELQEWQEQHFDDLQMIRKHAVAGTTDDPEWPYK